MGLYEKKQGARSEIIWQTEQNMPQICEPGMQRV